jgi:hypothetical protein
MSSQVIEKTITISDLADAIAQQLPAAIANDNLTEIVVELPWQVKTIPIKIHIYKKEEVQLIVHDG